MSESIKDRLVVALDVETAGEARELFAGLRDHAGMFKIGSQLFTAAGPEIVRELVGAGARIFLDLKFHDIPNTVAAAGVEAARLGVFMFNVHALGGSHMMRRTHETVAETSEREGLRRPRIIAVTVLTSADSATLEEVSLPADTAALVRRLALLTKECGLDGVVASPIEIGLVRSCVPDPNFLIVTPGVRLQGTAADDQKRFMTPAEAFGAGADYLVVGRAILNAPDPQRACLRIIDEMARAHSARSGSGI